MLNEGPWRIRLFRPHPSGISAHRGQAAAGTAVELHRTYAPSHHGRGDTPTSRELEGTILWVWARHAVACEVRLYDRRFSVADPAAVEGGKDITSALNPGSLVVVPWAYIEPRTVQDEAGSRYQFERTVYFVHNAEASVAAGKPVYNRTVTLWDSWEKAKETA